jgi:hypothetical protein
MAPNPRHIIRPAAGTRMVIYRDGNTSDIVRVIMLADKDSERFVIKSGLTHLRGDDDRDTLENIYAFVKGKTRYKADRPGHEIIRSPAYLFESGVGDCKSLSIAVGALCRAFGIPYRYRFISQGGKRNLHHVYVVASADGKDVILDAVHRSFDSEPTYSRRVDIRAGQRIPAGLHGPSKGFWLDTLTLAGVLIAAGWVLKKIGKWVPTTPRSPM